MPFAELFVSMFVCLSWVIYLKNIVISKCLKIKKSKYIFEKIKIRINSVNPC